MTIRVAILCNDRICLPAVNWLIQSGITVAVGMPAGSHETRQLVQLQCTRSNVPFESFEKESFSVDLDRWLQQYRPDVVLVKTFPWLIPAELLTVPSKGFINFHYAPLPAFRGPNPLFWMIRQQVQEGGVTVHLMDEQFDTGPIILQQSLSISPDLTYGWLVTQLAYAGLQLCWALLQGLVTGTLDLSPQPDCPSKWYPRATPADLAVNWERMSAPEIRALCLACNPWNKGAATSWNNWNFGITDVTILNKNNNVNVQPNFPGTIIAISKQNGLIVSCLHDQLLKINVIYCEEGFFPGHQLASFGIQPGHRLGNHTMPHAHTSQPSSALHQSS